MPGSCSWLLLRILSQPFQPAQMPELMSSPLSDRDRIRDKAENVLLAERQPLHYKKIAEIVLPQLGLTNHRSAKYLNNSLHEDKHSRFVSLGKGVWALSSWSRNGSSSAR